MICNRYADNYSSIGLGNGLALLVKNRMSSPDSNCTTAIQAGLARHPAYAGTKLELLAAYELCGMQNPNGAWPSHKISGMLHFASLNKHLLAIFLALRSLPQLIKNQKGNGLWFSDDGKENVHDIILLQALKEMGILDKLRKG